MAFYGAKESLPSQRKSANGKSPVSVVRIATTVTALALAVKLIDPVNAIEDA